jgi:NADH:ubiquinone oxidoreductase subunit 6 (subunit J)
MDTLKFFHQPIDMIYYIDNVDTMQALGVYLYVLLFFAIYLLGSILLVSMIGAIL